MHSSVDTNTVPKIVDPLAPLRFASELYARGKTLEEVRVFIEGGASEVEFLWRYYANKEGPGAEYIALLRRMSPSFEPYDLFPRIADVAPVPSVAEEKKDPDWSVVLNCIADKNAWSKLTGILDGVSRWESNNTFRILLHQFAYGLSSLPPEGGCLFDPLYRALEKYLRVMPRSFVMSLCSRFIDVENLKILLEAGVFSLSVQGDFKRRLCTIQKIDQAVLYAPHDAGAPLEKLKLTYGDGVPQALFREIQSNLVKDFAAKLPAAEKSSLLNFKEYMMEIFQARYAIATKAYLSDAIDWFSRAAEPPLYVLETSVGERYFPYYIKGLNAVLSAVNQSFLFVQHQHGIEVSIMYTNKYMDPVLLTSYTMNCAWTHAPVPSVSKAMYILEQQYRSLLAEPPPRDEEDFRQRLLPQIAESHWLFAHACPFTRGSAFVAEVVTRAMCLKFGFECAFGAWMPDCEALATPDPEVFKAVFEEKVSLYQNEFRFTVDEAASSGASSGTVGAFFLFAIAQADPAVSAVKDAEMLQTIRDLRSLGARI